MFPIAFLKTYEVIGSVLCILTGVFGMVFYPVLLETNFNPGIESDKRAAIIWAFFIVSLVVFVSAVLFVIGKMKKIACCILIYNVVVISAALALLILASMSSYIPFHIMSNTCTPSMVGAPSWSQQLQLADNKANATFCQQPCPCSVNSTAFDTYPTQVQSQMFALLPYMSLYSSNYSGSIMECVNAWSNFTEEQQESARFMGQMEVQFQCAGWCSPDITYMFTPVTSGFRQVPTETCQQALVNYYHSWGRKCMVVSWILFGIMALNTIMVLCKLCHPSKRQGSIYQRLAA